MGLARTGPRPPWSPGNTCPSIGREGPSDAPDTGTPATRYLRVRRLRAAAPDCVSARDRLRSCRWRQCSGPGCRFDERSRWERGRAAARRPKASDPDPTYGRAIRHRRTRRASGCPRPAHGREASSRTTRQEHVDASGPFGLQRSGNVTAPSSVTIASSGASVASTGRSSTRCAEKAKPTASGRRPVPRNAARVRS